MKNKTVLITGASSGIGEACAYAFAREGAKLILCARRQERLHPLSNTLKKEYNTKTYTIPLDVQDNHAIKNAFSNLPAEWQSIDILINNAGLALALDKIQEGETSDWDQLIDTNIKGLLYMTRMILPQMIKRNQGHIVNIGSIAGHEVYSGGVVYAASKHAVNAIIKGLLLDLMGT